MKPIFLGLCLLTATSGAVAQPQTPASLANIGGAALAAQPQTIALAQLAQRGQPALLNLREPLNGETQVMAVAWGKDGVLLSSQNGFTLKTLPEMEAMYGGTALVTAAPASALQIENAMQIVPITALGGDALVTAKYTLTNTGQTPLDVSVASTSCGCTGATLDLNRIEPGQSAQLTANMHASDERLVRVTLNSSDAAWPQPVVAVQSKRTFAPFQVPSPVSLYGEKGQLISAQTEFELPVGWQVARVVVSPDWLEAKLEPQAAAANADALPRYRLAITAPASAPEGTLQGQIKLELTGAPLQSLSVPVGGFVSNDISASPRLIALKDSPQGLARRVVVIHGPRPFSIRAITSPMPGFEARFEPTIAAKAHAVELVLPIAGKVGDSFFERAAVTLSDGRELPLDIMGSVGQGTLPDLAANVKLNKLAPTFAGTDANGNAVASSDFAGQSNLLLTFFPHCFTGGCESHLASLRDAAPALAATGTRIVAVSTDDAAQVKAFAAQLGLPFPVISDADRKIALAFGAVQNKSEAPSRISILIDKRGIVRWINTDVHVKTHGADVLTKIGELGLQTN